MFQYYVVFVLLVVESIFLICLLFPLPSFVQTFVLSVLNKLRHFVRFIAVAMLFFTIDQTLEMRREEQRKDELPRQVEMSKENFYQVRRFRAERNFYLCAFTFSLLIILLRLESITRKLRECQQQLKKE